MVATQADIWGVGITAIEMAEKKPPLFEMNTMSALYHIPQNDPPTLAEPAIWSDDFHDFLRKCLQKKAEDRSTAADLCKVRPGPRHMAGGTRTSKGLGGVG